MFFSKKSKSDGVDNPGRFEDEEGTNHGTSLERNTTFGLAAAAALTMGGIGCTPNPAAIKASTVLQVHSVTSESSPGSSGVEVRADYPADNEKPHKVGGKEIKVSLNAPFVKATAYKATDDSFMSTIEGGTAASIELPLGPLTLSSALSGSVGMVDFRNLFEHRVAQQILQLNITPSVTASWQVFKDFKVNLGVGLPLMYWGKTGDIRLGSSNNYIAPNQSGVALSLSGNYRGVVEVGCTPTFYPQENLKDYSTCWSTVDIIGTYDLLTKK